MDDLGIVGLGIMGGAMAAAFVRAGHVVHGFDVAPAAVDAFVANGGQAAASAEDVARAARTVILSLPSSEALADVTDRICSSVDGTAAADLILVEMSMLPLAAKDAARIRCEAAGVTIVDCPMSGTAVQLENRSWVIYCSGPEAALERLRPVFSVLATSTPNLGAFGMGMKMKLVANHMVLIYNVAYAESLNFVRRLGMDEDLVTAILMESPALATGLMRLRLPMMRKRDYSAVGAKLSLAQKDAQVIGDGARAANCPTPLFDASAAIYAAAMASGRADEDVSSVSEAFRAMTGSPSAPPAAGQ